MCHSSPFEFYLQVDLRYGYMPVRGAQQSLMATRQLRGSDQILVKKRVTSFNLKSGFAVNLSSTSLPIDSHFLITLLLMTTFFDSSFGAALAPHSFIASANFNSSLCVGVPTSGG